MKVSDVVFTVFGELGLRGLFQYETYLRLDEVCDMIARVVTHRKLRVLKWTFTNTQPFIQSRDALC